MRVEQNIARALQATLGRDRVGLCTWNNRRRTFLPRPDVELESVATQGRCASESLVAHLPATKGKRALLERVGLIPAQRKGMGTHDPDALFRRLAGRARRKIAALADSLASRIGQRFGSERPDSAGRKQKGLQPGDVLITLGLEWEIGCMPFLQGLKDRIGIRIIGCCHDLVPVKYPQYCIRYVAEQFPEYLVQLVRACDAIACVSECTLRDLREEIKSGNLPPPRLFTIRLGADLPAAAGPPSELISSLTGRPYVLFVSTIERRKNHEILYRAFHRLAEVHGRDQLPRMVFVGARGWGVSDLLNDIELDPITKGLIVQLHQVADHDLRILYQKALFCVFPSLYEGWGLTVAEALGFGTPVVCSDRGPLSEVGGDLVEYLDPWDLPAWVRTIERLWLDGDYRRRLADRIAREYRIDDWSMAGAQIGQIALGLEAGSEICKPA